MRIALYTGASSGHDPRWAQAADELGRSLARAGHTLVYGGGSKGLMGTVADAFMAEGAHVIGVIPQHLVDAETAHTGLSELEVVDTMGTRKARMAELADAMVALPGGIGTLEEFFEVWVAQVLGLHRKPVALYSPHGFWDQLATAFDQMLQQGFLPQTSYDGLVVAESPTELLAKLEHWQAPTPRWAK